MALFGGMVPVYWAAQYISTGLISVIFGIAPIITGFLAWRFIYEQRFSTMKMLGALSGLAGLISIFATGMAMGENYAYGVVAVLGAVVLHSISAVWIKSMKVDIAPISTVAGGLLFSMPMFIAVYLIFAPPLAGAIPMRALWSIVYLGIVGSVLPVLALWIGRVFENEKMGFNIYMGTVLVLMGLTLHQWGDFLFKKLWKKRKLYST